MTKPKKSQEHNKCLDIFKIPLFLAMVRPNMIFYYFRVMLRAQHIYNKSYVENCYWFLIKKKKKKKQKQQQQPKKIVYETVNFGSSNLTKPKKKKSRSTTKCHNISQCHFQLW